MKYTVSAKVTISIDTVVDAESEKEALRIAGDREDIETYEWGYSNKNEVMWVADDYDGDPFDLEIHN